MKASRRACCCCSANGRSVGCRMAPVWIPPVTEKLAPSAARPAALLERAETGARPLSAAILARLCASAPALIIIRARRPTPHIDLFIAPLLHAIAGLALSGDSFARSRQDGTQKGARRS